MSEMPGISSYPWMRPDPLEVDEVDECTCEPAVGRPFSAYRVEGRIDRWCPVHGEGKERAGAC